MQEDFHYYATYCAAYLAGYSHEESEKLCFAAQLVDHCSRSFLARVKAPANAATTQLQLEMMDIRMDTVSIQDITRIWASFHFLPGDLFSVVNKGSKKYKDKYRLICNTNGALLSDTVELAKGKGVEHAGIAMHVLCDTWAHRYFAGTPSFVINNTNEYFFEIIESENGEEEKKITFEHKLGAPDDPENSIYINTISQLNEKTIMNLGHGRAGHLPDYSYIKYKYLPAWGNYEVIIKDNPSDYLKAFTQMVYALKYLHGDEEKFELDRYDNDCIKGHEEKIDHILRKRQTDACPDWKAFGEELSGKSITEFDPEKYDEEYLNAEDPDKDDTYLGRFILASLAQKSMVTNRIFRSGNKLAGYSVEYSEKGFRGIREFKRLINYITKGIKK